MNPFRYHKIFLLVSGVVVAVAVAGVVMFGINFGIEFTGGSVLEVEYEEARPPIEEIRAQLHPDAPSVQEMGDRGVMIRMQETSIESRERVLGQLRAGGQEVHELQFEAIGPTIGRELREKTIITAAFAIAVILLYIAFAFRRVTEYLHSWHYSIASVLALLHDIVIPVGILALLGALHGVQFTIPIVVALLTVLGYSINNTVVVFDRIRENSLDKKEIDFSDILRKSFRQTLSRSINTSLTTLLVLFAIFFFGGETLRYFALALIIGITAGTYSSLFLAPSLLLVLSRRKLGRA